MAEGKQTVAGAYDQIEAHEKLCAERLANLHGRIDDVASDVKAIKDEGREDRKWLRGLVFALLAWLALQIYQDLRAKPPATSVTVASAAK